MKKTQKTLLFLIIICISLVLSTAVKAENISEKFMIQFDADGEENLKGIEVSISKSYPVYDNQSISQFDNIFFSKYETNSNGIIEFDRPSDYFLIELNMLTIPSEFYVKEKTIFIQNDINIYNIKLYKNDTNEMVSYMNEQLIVSQSFTYNNKQEKLYSETIETSSYIDVVNIINENSLFL